MNKLLVVSVFVFSVVASLIFAAGDGNYGSEAYGSFSYGVSSNASSSFSNSSVATTANAITTVNASSLSIVLEIVTNSNTSGTVTVVRYDSQPPNVGTNSFASPLSLYIDIVVDDSISSQLNYSMVKVQYTDAQLAAANLQESTLRLSRWNGSGWVQFDSPNGGVDTGNNVVWANTSAFSFWGVFGTLVPAPSTSTGGGGSGYKWKCTGWSECGSSGIQTRICTNEGSNRGTVGKPAEAQSCTYVPPTQMPAAGQTPAEPTEPLTTGPGSAEQGTEASAGTIGQDNAGTAPTGGNLITGQAIGSGGNVPSWWVSAIVLTGIIGLITGGYFYFKKSDKME